MSSLETQPARASGELAIRGDLPVVRLPGLNATLATLGG
jgi:hypothetical protein